MPCLLIQTENRHHSGPSDNLGLFCRFVIFFTKWRITGVKIESVLTEMFFMILELPLIFSLYGNILGVDGKIFCHQRACTKFHHNIYAGNNGYVGQ